MHVDRKFIHLPEAFPTESGASLKQPLVAYEEYGQPDGPVILIAHGTLSDQHAAGSYGNGELAAGWWDGLIGEGRVFDTRRFRILCMNSLGSMYGSVSPLTVNPDTGCRYGPYFPEITLTDMVRFQKAFLDALEVEELYLVAGPSMGALQSLRMAALYPEYVGAVVAVAAAGRTPPAAIAMNHFIINTLTMDPDFQGGWYDLNRPLLGMKIVHQFLRINFAHEDLIKTALWDSVQDGPQSQRERCRLIARYLAATLDTDIHGRDPNCYIRLLEAINGYDLGCDAEDYESGVLRIQCPVLLMNVDTDAEFQVQWAGEVADILNTRSPGQARVGVLDSPWGHLGSIKETEQLAEAIGGFMAEL